MTTFKPVTVTSDVATGSYMPYNIYIPSSDLLFCGYEVIMMKPMV